MSSSAAARLFRTSLCALIATAVCITATTAVYTQAGKTPEQEVEALVMEFTRYEDAGDMVAQTRLTASDRWWHGIGGRRTDNATYMRVQQDGLANTSKRYPGLKTIREVRDLRLRTLSPTIVIASFTWFPNRLIPPDLPSDKVQALGPAPIPQVISQVWVRQTDGWKIVSSHHTPEYLR
jgi:hypothetical protein